jgi:hypothetical protein
MDILQKNSHPDVQLYLPMYLIFMTFSFFVTWASFLELRELKKSVEKFNGNGNEIMIEINEMIKSNETTNENVNENKNETTETTNV